VPSVGKKAIGPESVDPEKPIPAILAIKIMTEFELFWLMKPGTARNINQRLGSQRAFLWGSILVCKLHTVRNQEINTIDHWFEFCAWL